MASDSPIGEPDADMPPEVAALDSKQDEPAAAAGTTTADQDPVPGLAAAEDAAEGTNGVTAADETVVDEVNLTRFCVEVGGEQADEHSVHVHGVILLAGGCSLYSQVIDAADDFVGGRVIGRDISENGNEDEPSSRRGRRGRSRLVTL